MERIVLGLANRTAGHPYVRGSIVRRLQVALNNFEPSIATVDSVFGKDTSGAVRKWQAANGMTETGEVTLGQYIKLVGTAPDDFETCLQLTSRFEGHGFEKAKGNFDGARVTWGIIGFTMLSGSLHEVIERIDKADKNAVKEAFGELEKNLRHALELPRDNDPSADWADAITVPGTGGELEPKWDAAFKKLGSTAVAQDQQIAQAQKDYWEKKAIHDFDGLGLVGIAGQALCFDIAVQCGGVSDSEKATIDKRLAAAQQPIKQQKRREIIANVVAEASANTKYIEDVRSRKMTIATGNGKVHGGWFSMRNWGLAADPNEDSEDNAIAPAAAVSRQPQPAMSVAVAGTAEQRFVDFISSLGLEFFNAEEFAYLGYNHKTPGKPGFGLNDLPPTELWPNIVRTAQIMDKLRADLKASVFLTNIYRSPEYNAAIDGAPGSMHTRFNAVDFYCKDGNPPSFWADKLAGYRSQGLFSGGIGIYSSKNFVHLDTRGVNKDFGQ